MEVRQGCHTIACRSTHPFSLRRNWTAPFHALAEEGDFGMSARSQAARQDQHSVLWPVNDGYTLR